MVSTHIITCNYQANNCYKNTVNLVMGVRIQYSYLAHFMPTSKAIVTPCSCYSLKFDKKLLTVVEIPLRVVTSVVVSEAAPPSFSQVMLGGGTPLALQDSVTSFHSRAETMGEGSERMRECAAHI